MTLVCLLAVFLIEHFQPLPATNAVRAFFIRYADTLSGQFNAGESRQGVFAWLLAVVPLLIIVLLLYYLLAETAVLLALAANVGVLYLAMGFGQLNSSFRTVLEALRESDASAAREALASWRQQSVNELDANGVARLAIEGGLVDAYRRVFGVMFWFAVLPGPSGVVLYWLAAFLNDHWGRDSSEEYVDFGGFAGRALAVLDWIPARLTALTFAIVGDFEDALYCWRTQAEAWGNPAQGVVLAAAAGALGVRLGEAVQQDGAVVFRPELGLGEQAGVEQMSRGFDLVWRSILIWLSLIGLVSLASWLG